MPKKWICYLLWMAFLSQFPWGLIFQGIFIGRKGERGIISFYYSFVKAWYDYEIVFHHHHNQWWVVLVCPSIVVVIHWPFAVVSRSLLKYFIITFAPVHWLSTKSTQFHFIQSNPILFYLILLLPNPLSYVLFLAHPFCWTIGIEWANKELEEEGKGVDQPRINPPGGRRSARQRKMWV
jgi:hypothetical protein